MDMDMDSPFSPQSSELSDIFEPPSALNTPLTNKKLAAKRPMVQNSFDKLKSTNLRQKTKAAAPGNWSTKKFLNQFENQKTSDEFWLHSWKVLNHFPGKPSKNKHIHMKIIDDQLRIIDEVPTSAVEMQVKEKVREGFNYILMNAQTLSNKQCSILLTDNIYFSHSFWRRFKGKSVLWKRLKWCWSLYTTGNELAKNTTKKFWENVYQRYVWN